MLEAVELTALDALELALDPALEALEWLFGLAKIVIFWVAVLVWVLPSISYVKVYVIVYTPALACKTPSVTFNTLSLSLVIWAFDAEFGKLARALPNSN